MSSSLCVFRNGRTAQNYVGYIRWACVHLNLSTEWFTESVRMVLKGATKLTLRETGGQVGARFRLTDQMISKMVRVSDQVGPVGFSEAVVLAWEFLLRVQSEAVFLQKGDPRDATSLDPSTHSGVWIDGGGNLVVRLQRRKHRPQGSMLIRKCMCAEVGVDRCPPHRLRSFLANLEVGQRLFAWSTQDWLRLVKRLLILIGSNGSDCFTLNAFRAGKATHLASCGATLGSIPAAGGWRSSAFLRYVDEDVVDASNFIGLSQELSDDEKQLSWLV